MNRPLKKSHPKGFLPFQLNWWISQKNKHFGLFVDDIYNATLGSGLDWIAITAIGCVTTKYFSVINPSIDVFKTGLPGTIEDQIVNAGIVLQSNEDVSELLTAEELDTYDVLYKSMVAFCTRMADESVEPLPVPPAPLPPKPEEPSPKPSEPEKPSPKPSEPEKPKGAWKEKAKTWAALIGSALTVLGAVSFFVPSLRPIVSALKMIWSALETIFK